LIYHEKEMTEHKIHDGGPAGAIYGLGFIGAAVYFIGEATTFWMGVLGFLKALVWPAFLVYGLLKYVGM
jgi:hypothetical protein